MFNILIVIAGLVGMVSAIPYLVVLFKHRGNPTYDSTVTLMGLALLAFVGCLAAQAGLVLFVGLSAFVCSSIHSLELVKIKLYSSKK